MKILFIIPPNIHYIEPYAYIEADKNNTERPALGLLYVAAALNDVPDVEMRIIDAQVDKLSLDDLEKVIKEESPDLIGFSVLTFNLLNCLEVCRIIRRSSPQTKICFGGWHPTLYPRETLAFDFVDYVVSGEGEYTFRELIQVLMAGHNDFEKELKLINGLGYKTERGDITLNPHREILKDLDQLPLPAYDLIDVSKYSHLLADSGHIVNIMTSRGCPQKCIFCDVRKTPYRFRTPANILQEVKYWTKRGIREFYIQDDNFAINRKRLIEFCRLLIEAGLDIKYKISSRVDYIDDELSEFLRRSGCDLIMFGVESGSQRILDYLQKGITVQDIRRAFQSGRKYGIDCGANIIIGAPVETKEDIDITMQLMKEIQPAHLHCSICTPMPKTYLYNKLMEDGVIKDDYWLEFARNPDPSFKTRFASQFFSTDKLRKMQSMIQKDFYFSPMVILREILKTQSFKQFVSKARMATKMLFH